MKERPILFSAPMVRALLAGTKTQTRREMKPQPYAAAKYELMPGIGYVNLSPQSRQVIACPYGQPGDRLWVKETWAAAFGWDNTKPTDICEHSPIYYKADGAKANLDAWDDCERREYGRLRPSIFMRRWMSRITLEIESVRVERLNDINRGDAMEEGCPFPNMADGEDPRKWYADLWESLNGSGSWAKNPWVWALTFKKL